MKDSKFADDNITKNNVENYGWKSATQPKSCNYVAPIIISLAKSLGIRRIADLGSGNGVLCGLLRDSGYDVVGIEHDRQGVKIARDTYPDIPFYNFGVQDDSKNILEKEPPFDLVVSTEVIEHLYSPHLLPIYAGSILNESGYLIISTPYHGYLKNLVISIFNYWDKHHESLSHGGHIKFWSKNTLITLLKESGFTTISFHGAGRFPWLWKSMIVVARKSSYSRDNGTTNHGVDGQA